MPSLTHVDRARRLTTASFPGASILALISKSVASQSSLWSRFSCSMTPIENNRPS